MSDLSFDRDRAGIAAKGHWTDADTFISIGFGYAELEGECDVVKDPVLEDSEHLFKACLHFVKLMRAGCLEFSDACATLGSGVKEATANYDQAEHKAVRDFDFMRGSIGKDTGK